MTGTEPDVVFSCCSLKDLHSRTDVFGILRCISAYRGCKKWIFKVGSIQWKPVCPFSFNLSR